MLSDDRWVEVTPSNHEHEREGLELLRQVLPDESPFRVWTNFEFKDGHGNWHEVDALVLGRSRLHLVELKFYSGTLRGNDLRWLRDGHRAEDSPLLLTRRKAQRFASKLKDELAVLARELNRPVDQLLSVVPWVQESVFMHHPRLRSELSDSAAIGIFGIDGLESTNLPGLSERLLEPANGRRQIHEDILVKLMERIGLVQRREQQVGNWSLIEPMAAADSHQDWLASHTALQDQLARLRFPLIQSNPSPQYLADLNRLVDHEYRVMAPLAHDGLLRPTELVSDPELGHGLVFPYDEKAQRLDLWLAGHGAVVSLDERLNIIRQVAETLQYAHRNKVVHRGLSPRALWVTKRPDGTHRVQVGDWQSVGAAGAAGTVTQGVTTLQAAESLDEASPDAVYQAPEGLWSTAANRVRLDIFGLGATAYFILTGTAPAADAQALKARLRDQQGLDVSVDLAAVSTELRNLLLKATQGVPAHRMSDVGDFLESLAAVQRALTNPATDHAADPLDARPGEALDERFTLVRRLGAGSTAVGLLVIDHDSRPANQQRVLKVALNDAAGHRLHAEADTLRTLRAANSRSIVKLQDGPLQLGGRDALVLSHAGTQTLADELSARSRLSLDMLERWGEDLLSAVVKLQELGIHHRDIKPANLGIAEVRKAKHLVLFDFSLASASPRALQAGTAPYLDPFLGGSRATFDAAAELYSTAVVLFEMATGQTPVYGTDASAHPASVADELTLSGDLFDPSLQVRLTDFFRQALAREASQRFTSASQMLDRWHQVFRADATVTPSDEDELAEQATPETLLSAAGFGPRALSAVEQFGAVTVADLIAVDPVLLNRMSGSADPTRRQVRSRATQWRKKFGAARTLVPAEPAVLPAPDQCHEILVRAASGRGESRSEVLHMLLGDNSEVDPFATQAEIAASLSKPVTVARATQIIGYLQDDWVKKPEPKKLLEDLNAVVRQTVRSLGGVATVEELRAAVLSAMPGGRQGNADEGRRALGLLRVISDRQRRLQMADEEQVALVWRRRDRSMALVGEDYALLDAVEKLGESADRIVAQTTDQEGITRVVVPADRAAEQLARTVRAEVPAALLATPRLAQLAAGLSQSTCASSIGELHHRDLDFSRALELTLRAAAPNAMLQTTDIASRVANRFPALPALPDRPRLDQLLQQAELDLVWDAESQRFISRQLTERGTQLNTNQATVLEADTAPVSLVGPVGQRLLDSRRSRSFLALGVQAHRQDRLVRVLRDVFSARVVDVSELVLRNLRELARSQARPIPWPLVLQADAAAVGSRERRGISALIARAATQAVAEIDELINAPVGDSPVVLVDGSLPARYGQMDILTRWNDLARTRRQAVWLVLPQTQANRGPVLDGHPVQGSPNQFVPVDTAWLDGQWNRLLSRDPSEGASA